MNTSHDPPRRNTFYDAVAEVGLCGGQWSLRNKRGSKPDLPAGALRTKRAPIGLILASRVSKRLIKSNQWLQPLEIPGAWATQNLEAGGILMLDLSALPSQPGMSFLRNLPTPTSAKQADERLRALLGDPLIPVLERNQFHEAIMNQSITSTNEERKSAYEIAIERGRQEMLAESIAIGDAREARALQNSIIGVLQVRKLAVSETQRAQLLDCSDAAVLNELLLKAVVVDSTTALLRES